jgi:hypothetical protein
VFPVSTVLGERFQQPARGATEKTQTTIRSGGQVAGMRIAHQRLSDDQRETSTPLRISVWPVTSHTRVPLGIEIIAASAP